MAALRPGHDGRRAFECHEAVGRERLAAGALIAVARIMAHAERLTCALSTFIVWIVCGVDVDEEGCVEPMPLSRTRQVWKVSRHWLRPTSQLLVTAPLMLGALVVALA